ERHKWKQRGEFRPDRCFDFVPTIDSYEPKFEARITGLSYESVAGPEKLFPWLPIPDRAYKCDSELFARLTNSSCETHSLRVIAIRDDIDRLPSDECRD